MSPRTQVGHREHPDMSALLRHCAAVGGVSFHAVLVRLPVLLHLRQEHWRVPRPPGAEAARATARHSGGG